jgi:RNA polymerase sigma factor (sigma-70 family)
MTSSAQVLDLVSQTAAGSRTAADALARWCLPRVRRTVLASVGAGPEGDDLVQNVMAQVLTKLHTFRGDASFYVWVDRITVNEVRGHYRRRRFRMTRLSDYSKEAGFRTNAAAPMPSEEVDRSRLMARLSNHIQRLKPAQRLPVVLSLVHGYTAPEIAAMLDLSFEATKKQIQRGKQDLQERVRRDPACRSLLPEGAR